MWWGILWLIGCDVELGARRDREPIRMTKHARPGWLASDIGGFVSLYVGGQWGFLHGN